MEFITVEQQIELKNPGVISKQLLSPHNSSSERVTITQVSIKSGEHQPRHIHDKSEQIWIATKGSAKLLLEGDSEKQFNVGEVVRFAENDVHGLKNDSEEEFQYISVTTPPVNFNYAYSERQ